jgi:hypothetical protein
LRRADVVSRASGARNSERTSTRSSIVHEVHETNTEGRLWALS